MSRAKRRVLCDAAIASLARFLYQLHHHRIGSQLHKLLLSQNWGSMWRSTFTTITSNNRLDTSEFEDEWRTDKILGRFQDG